MMHSDNAHFLAPTTIYNQSLRDRARAPDRYISTIASDDEHYPPDARLRVSRTRTSEQ